MRSSHCAIGDEGSPAYLGAMIVATVLLTDLFDAVGTLSFEFDAHPSYGATAEMAHDLLVLCLTAAEKPVVIDAGGKVHHLPRDLVRGVITRVVTEKIRTGICETTE